MEMEADEAGEDPDVGPVGVDEHLLHDGVSVRARVVVVVLAELRRRAMEAQRGHHHCEYHTGGGRGTGR